MNDTSKSPEPISPKFRVKRNPRHVQPAEDIPMGELETHYRRLCRVGKDNLWKKGFGLLAVVLLGGVVGAALAGPGWTWEVKAAAALTALAGLAWKGISETEVEGISAIREDFKEDILDSLVLDSVGDISGSAHSSALAELLLNTAIAGAGESDGHPKTNP